MFPALLSSCGRILGAILLTSVVYATMFEEMSGSLFNVDGCDMNREKELSACDLFGGMKNLADKIVSRIRAQAGAAEYFGEPLQILNPVQALAQIPKQQLTRFLFVNDIPSSDIFPSVDWGANKPQWEERTSRFLAVGSNGSPAPRELALRLCVQQHALDELLAPPSPPSPEETRRIETFRAHFRSAIEV